MAKAKKPKPTKGQAVRQMLAAITGRTADDGEYIGKAVWGRAGSEDEKKHGKVTNTSICAQSGCGGTRLHVIWKDGKRTYPCAKGCKVRENGDLEIK